MYYDRLSGGRAGPMLNIIIWEDNFIILQHKHTYAGYTAYTIGITSIETGMDEVPTAIQLNRWHCSLNKDDEYAL